MGKKMLITGDKAGHVCREAGFTLIELMVSVAITSILMLGMSTFFSTTFTGLLRAQTKVQAAQSQFVINSLIQEKLDHITAVTERGAGYALLHNDTDKNGLPFTYIATDDAGHLAIRDILAFIKANGTVAGNGKTGEIAVGSYKITGLPNLAGFAEYNGNYYVALPLANQLRKCGTPVGSDVDCTNGAITLKYNSADYALSMPMDMAVGGSSLYVSDAGSGRILKADLTNLSKDVEIVAKDLKFPSGLAYYEKDGKSFLFVAETLNNTVKRIGLSEGPITITTVAGAGDDTDCGADGKEHTALYCRLSLPTVLYADSNANELYINDSGNSRILKITDPGKKASVSLPVPVSYNQDTLLDHIDFTFFGSGSFTSAPDVTSATLPKGVYKMNGGTLTANFFTTLASAITLPPPSCTTPSPLAPPVCIQNPFTSMQTADDLFKSGDTVKISANEYDVISDATSPNYTYGVNGDTAVYLAGTAVYHGDSILNKTANSTDTVNIDVSEVYTGPVLSALPDFVPVKIGVYKQGDSNPVQDNLLIIRNGDDVLGTKEDMITVVLAPSAFFSTVAGPQFDPADPAIAFDSVSDFKVDDNSLSFEKSNSDQILQINFSVTTDAAKQAYTFTGKL